jgi:hypothetical protein
MFNLYVEIDPTNETNYLIEPREDFLTSEKINLSHLLAHDKDLKIIPMAKLDATDYLFSYKQDKDYWNQKYESDHQRIYGDRKVTNTNDFVTKQHKTDIIFSPTPLVAPANDDRVISTILAMDDQNYPKTIDHNIRILYYGGLKDCSVTWVHKQILAGGLILETVFSQYPYAGHWDDPFNPTEDINFGLPYEVYFDDNINVITATNNNLYNKYYSNMIRAYTDKESKIVSGFFNMQPQDFKEWTFDKLYFFENAYFRLHKIYNYNPTSEGLTKCDFLYLTNVPTVTATGVIVDGDDSNYTGSFGGGSVDEGELKPTKDTDTSSNIDDNNTTGRGTKVQGKDNYVSSSAYFIEIQGDSNRVYNDTENVKIQGDNNVVEGGLKNITLINSSDLTIDESNVTYIDGVKVDAGTISSPSAVEDISASQDAAVDVKAYKIDTSGGDVTMQ